ncbi:MAG: hypothetical protein ACPGES_01680 [Coraliomargarita sp.]
MNAELNAGDALVYTFEQVPYWADTQNIHTLKGYQRVYQGPLLLGTITETELALPADAKLSWNAETKQVDVSGSDVKLSPINDVIDNNYVRGTYKRQALWKKAK